MFEIVKELLCFKAKIILISDYGFLHFSLKPRVQVGWAVESSGQTAHCGLGVCGQRFFWWPQLDQLRVCSIFTEQVLNFLIKREGALKAFCPWCLSQCITQICTLHSLLFLGCQFLLCPRAKYEWRQQKNCLGPQWRCKSWNLLLREPRGIQAGLQKGDWVLGER